MVGGFLSTNHASGLLRGPLFVKRGWFFLWCPFTSTQKVRPPKKVPKRTSCVVRADRFRGESVEVDTPNLSNWESVSFSLGFKMETKRKPEAILWLVGPVERRSPLRTLFETLP